MTEYQILAMDMGGTKTNIALFSARIQNGIQLSPKSPVHSLVNSDFTTPEQLIQAGLDRIQPLGWNTAVMAVAGPVTSESARLTNLSWTLHAQQVSEQFGFSAFKLINDMEAMVHGIPFLQDADLCILNPKPAIEKAAIAVIAPGTGLGESFMTWTDGHYLAHASEAGHCDFAPTDVLQIDLLHFLLKQYDHVSYERICSGAGLHHIYRFLKLCEHMDEPPWLSEQLAQGFNPVESIVAAAKDSGGSCGICKRAVQLFVQVLGAEAGNLALRLLPRGGLFIGGGIPPRLVEFFLDGLFMTAYRSKGRMSALLDQFPVKLILNPHTPLFGAAYCGFMALQ